MISLQPIHKNIRKTLDNKSRAVSRDFSDPLAPVDMDVIRETYAKTTWVKMFSPVDSTAEMVSKMGPIPPGDTEKELVTGQKPGLDTVSIVNGVLDKSGDMFSGFDSLYRQGERGGGPLAPATGTDGEVKIHRPIPGIKDVTIDYKDGLAAIRTATINWTCWTFEDLEILAPHFMSTGVGVLLEWGWSVPGKKPPLLFDEKDMVNGKAYYLIQDKVIANAGNYDAMAGIISNWEWSLRADGGFDCTTTLTSRGVNILQGDSAAPGTKVVNDEGIVQPPLKIFVGGLKETLFDLTADGATWFDATKHKDLTPIGTAWKNGDKTQPPGVLSWTADNTLPFTNISAGPWVTWGFLEDNILSRFAGLVTGENGRPVSSFRSIEPVLKGDDGQYEDNDGNGVDNPFEARFQSVIIRNSEWLLTPSFNRWILPGQFPAGEIAPEHFGIKVVKDYGDFIMDVHKNALSDETYFKDFAVDKNDKNKGGYLRNILISYDLIEDAFSDAINVKDGMSNLFDEFTKDLDGYWNFNLITDIHNPGNTKVVDTNQTHETVKSLLENREGKENPDSKLFVFPSWGEKSIVKSQTLNQKIPNAMAISAMYAQTSDNKDAATPEGQAMAKLSSSDGAKDKSQPNVHFPDRIGKTNAYGSISPYGDLEKGKYYSSDKLDNSAIPNGQTFGSKHGVEFDLDMAELLKYYLKATQASDKASKEKTKKDIQEEKEKQKQKRVQADTMRTKDLARKNFEELVIKKKLDVKGMEEHSWWEFIDQTYFTVYNRDGNLSEAFEYYVLPGHTMIEYIHGTTLPLNTDENPDEADKIKKIDMPIPIELEITIDGTGGIIPGNPFQVDYIPQRYNKYTVFQSLSVGHTIDSSNWTTTIKGQIRVSMDKIKD